MGERQDGVIYVELYNEVALCSAQFGERQYIHSQTEPCRESFS